MFTPPCPVSYTWLASLTSRSSLLSAPPSSGLSDTLKFVNFGCGVHLMAISKSGMQVQYSQRTISHGFVLISRKCKLLSLTERGEGSAVRTISLDEIPVRVCWSAPDGTQSAAVRLRQGLADRYAVGLKVSVRSPAYTAGRLSGSTTSTSAATGDIWNPPTGTGAGLRCNKPPPGPVGVLCGRGRNPTLSGPAVLTGQVDMFPAKRRDMGEERRIGSRA